MPCEGEDPEAFDPSGGGTGTPSGEHEEDEQEMDRHGPELVIRRKKARGGDDAHHLERAVPDSFLDGAVIAAGEKHRGGEEDAEKDNGGVEPELLVTPVGPRLPEKEAVMEDEVHP